MLGTLVALTVVGSSAVAVAIPVVREELDLTVSDSAWIFAVFQLTFAVATATFGRVADLVGLRRPLVIGITMMTIGSIMVGAAPGFGVLLAGRVIQGIGAGAVPVLANGIVGTRFTGEARTAIYASITAVVSAVSGSGPVIGGGMEALLGWRWVFAVPALGILLIPSILPLAPSDRGQGSFDGIGAATSALGITGFLLLLQAPSAGGVVGAVGALLLLTMGPAAAWWIRREPEGFIPQSVVGNAVIARCAGVAALCLAGYFGALFATPVMIADAFGWQPLQIGLALLPAAALGAIGSRVAGALTGRFGHFRVAGTAAAISTSTILIASAGNHVLPLIVLGLAGGSIGFSGAQVAMTDRVTTAAPEGTLGVTLGVYNMLQFAGGAAGSALIGGLSDLVSLEVALACSAVLPATGAWLAVSGHRAGVATQRALAEAGS